VPQLRKIVYGDQGITMNFINYVSESDRSRTVEMAGELFRMQEHNPCRKLTAIRWLESVEDLKTIGPIN
jgi:hypothetical protein